MFVVCIYDMKKILYVRLIQAPAVYDLLQEVNLSIRH